MRRICDEFDDWIASARQGELSDAGVARLAEQLAASGARLNGSEKTADLASTGGPGSLSTVWAPAALVALGFTVPKLGVPGRPAGGVDVLAQVPGYRVRLDLSETRTVLDRCRYAHVLAGDTFAPADARFFAHRQKVGAQAIPFLAIASLLSKKLAMGVRVVGLEVRVATHGNFGATAVDAAANARCFCRVAALLGMEATCILTDGSIPQQPYLGRGEALLAVSRLFSGEAPDWLDRHARVCEVWAATVGRLRLPSRLAIAYAFAANLIAQGGSVDRLEEKAARVACAHDRVLSAPHDGVVTYDLGRLRDAIVLTRGADGPEVFDDSAGVILLVEPGRPVRCGEPLLSARCSENRWLEFREGLANAVRVDESHDGSASLGLAGALEVVRVGSR
jgi:pyrimidine-nucleoside phosphorylase